MTVGDRIRQKRIDQGVTQQELADKVGISKQAIYKYEANIVTNIPTDRVDAMAKALHCSPSFLMGWEASPPPRNLCPVPKMKKVPLLGHIACGSPTYAEGTCEGFSDMPETISADYSLICKGDSMIDAGIRDGDTVFIRAQPVVENGQIAAVSIGDDTTLKKVYRYPDMLVLCPCNEDYPDIILREEEMNAATIEGLAVGWIHLLKV